MDKRKQQRWWRHKNLQWMQTSTRTFSSHLLRPTSKSASHTDSTHYLTFLSKVSWLIRALPLCSGLLEVANLRHQRHAPPPHPWCSSNFCLFSCRGSVRWSRWLPACHGGLQADPEVGLIIKTKNKPMKTEKSAGMTCWSRDGWENGSGFHSGCLWMWVLLLCGWVEVSKPLLINHYCPSHISTRFILFLHLISSCPSLWLIHLDPLGCDWLS